MGMTIFRLKKKSILRQPIGYDSMCAMCRYWNIDIYDISKHH